MTQEEIEARVESWNWNCDIFEIYDELKEERVKAQTQLINYAMKFFNTEDSQARFRELAFHFNVDLEEDEDE
jgi:hypothetical protein